MPRRAMQCRRPPSVSSVMPMWMLIGLMVCVGALSSASAERPRSHGVPVPLFVSWGGIGSEARVRAAARIGVNLHRLPVGWPDASGKYDFTGTDAMIRALHKAGIRVILHFFNHGVPQWFWKAHPDARPQDALGNVTEDYPSPWNPYVRAAVERNMAAILEHLKNVHLLSLVDGVEIGVGMEVQLSYLWDTYRASDPYALRAYHRYLTAIYNKDLGQLNRDWGTHYSSFDEIRPPFDTASTTCHTISGLLWMQSARPRQLASCVCLPF